VPFPRGLGKKRSVNNQQKHLHSRGCIGCRTQEKADNRRIKFQIIPYLTRSAGISSIPSPPLGKLGPPFLLFVGVTPTPPPVGPAQVPPQRSMEVVASKEKFVSWTCSALQSPWQTFK
jgi:hypothetical protein